jgi:hypothetical protein
VPLKTGDFSGVKKATGRRNQLPGRAFLKHVEKHQPANSVALTRPQLFSALTY